MNVGKDFLVATYRRNRVAAGRAALALRGVPPAPAQGVPQSDFGTIAGQHTIAEVGELIAAKDAELAAIQATLDANTKVVALRDPSWQDDFEALKARYKSARDYAINAYPLVASIPLPGTTLLFTEGAWTRILAALRAHPEQPQAGPKDAQGLADRLGMIGLYTDFSKVPQPSEPDLDLHAFKAADVVTKKVDALADTSAKAVTSATPWILGGLAVFGVGYAYVSLKAPLKALRSL